MKNFENLIIKWSEKRQKLIQISILKLSFCQIDMLSISDKSKKSLGFSDKYSSGFAFMSLIRVFRLLNDVAKIVFLRVPCILKIVLECMCFSSFVSFAFASPSIAPAINLTDTFKLPDRSVSFLFILSEINISLYSRTEMCI